MHALNLTGGRRIPLIRQAEAAECGFLIASDDDPTLHRKTMRSRTDGE